MPKVISLFSQYANGKDSVADFLITRLNQQALYIEDRWKKIGFAQAVKKIFMEAFDVNWDFIEEWKRKDEAPTGFNMNVRKGLQFIGDGFRQIMTDVWIKIALRNPDNVIIADGRYLNEARAVHDRQGFNILLWRPGFENNDPNKSESEIKTIVDWFAKSGIEGPISFKAFEDVPEACRLFHYFLINDGNLEQLYNKIDESLLPMIKMYCCYGNAEDCRKVSNV